MMKYFFTLLCVAMCHLTVMAQEESQAVRPVGRGYEFTVPLWP